VKMMQQTLTQNCESLYPLLQNDQTNKFRHGHFIDGGRLIVEVSKYISLIILWSNVLFIISGPNATPAVDGVPTARHLHHVENMIGIQENHGESAMYVPAIVEMREIVSPLEEAIGNGLDLLDGSLREVSEIGRYLVIDPGPLERDVEKMCHLPIETERTYR
jgi:hypothetical protein